MNLHRLFSACLFFVNTSAGNLYATPAFQKDFGYLYEGKYIISAPWQTGLSSWYLEAGHACHELISFPVGNPIGQVLGAFFAAYPMEWYGRKLTFGVCVILTAAFVFIQFFARSLQVLLVGELLGGLVLGTYATIAPTYASEGERTFISNSKASR